MRIAAISLYEVSLALRAPFRTSTGELNDATHLLLRATTNEGIVAWGECACEPAPNFGAETLETCWHVLNEFLIPSVIGVEWSSPAEVAGMLSGVRGNNFAKAAVDIAAWDAYAQANGQSLAQALGGTRQEIESGVSIGLQPTIEETVELAARVVNRGYKRLKLKIVPGLAEELITAIQTVSGQTPLVVDANGCFPAGAHIELVRLERFGLAMIEQPFAPEELLLHRHLAEALETPVCLDESVPTPAQIELALDLGAADIINIKVSRLGGLTAARTAHNLCVARGIPVWCGGMHEFGIGRAANVAIASLPGFTLPGDISASEERFLRDLVDPPIAAIDGIVAVPAVPGLGVAVDEEQVLATARRQQHFEAGSSPTRTTTSARGAVPTAS